MAVLGNRNKNQKNDPTKNENAPVDLLNDSFFPRKEFLDDVTPEDEKKGSQFAGIACTQATLKPEAERTIKVKKNVSLTKSISKDIHEKATELGDKAWDLATTDDLGGADMNTKLKVATEAKELAMNYAISEEHYEFRKKEDKKKEPEPDPRDKSKRGRSRATKKH